MSHFQVYPGIARKLRSRKDTDERVLSIIQIRLLFIFSPMYLIILISEFLVPQGGDEEKFKLVVEAHSVLSDPNRRERYDNGEDEDGMNDSGGMGGMGGMSHMDLAELFSHFHGGGGGGGFSSFGGGSRSHSHGFSF